MVLDRSMTAPGESRFAELLGLEPGDLLILGGYMIVIEHRLSSCICLHRLGQLVARCRCAVCSLTLVISAFSPVAGCSAVCLYPGS
jgi:hypothetical protein